MRESKTESEISKKVSELILDIGTCMMTSLTPEGRLQSRPMMLQEIDEAGDLWFFTSIQSGKTLSIELEENVNLAFASTAKDDYVSVAGIAEVIQNSIRAQELWSVAAKAWFPKGPTDPELALLRVRVISAEYWDSPSASVVQVFGLAKAILTGKKYKNPGENARTANFVPPDSAH